jgi:hypothetical protein
MDANLDANKELQNTFLEPIRKAYNDLVQLLNQVPLHLTYRHNCYLNLDQALFWAREGISMIKLPDPVPPAGDATSPQPDNVVPVPETAAAPEVPAAA